MEMHLLKNVEAKLNEDYRNGTLPRAEWVARSVANHNAMCALIPGGATCYCLTCREVRGK